MRCVEINKVTHLVSPCGTMTLCGRPRIFSAPEWDLKTEITCSTCNKEYTKLERLRREGPYGLPGLSNL